MNNYIIVILLIVLFCILSKKKENYSINIKPTHTLSKINDHYIKNQNCKDFSETLKNPNNYMEMLQHLFNDLSTNEKIDESKLNEDYYYGDSEYITNFLNNKINKLIDSKNYLQKNNKWKYEQFHTTEPIIKYYVSKDFNLYKIIFILANTIRSTYTLCKAIIKEDNDKLYLLNVTLANSNDSTESVKSTNILPLDIEYTKYDNIELNIEPDIPDEFK